MYNSPSKTNSFDSLETIFKNYRTLILRCLWVTPYVLLVFKIISLGEKSYTKDSANLVKIIKSIKLEPAENIVSFDMEDMYPSLPTAEMVKKVIKLPHFRPKINKEAFIKICEVCLSQMYCRVAGHYFELTDGLFIGPLSSSLFAEQYLQKLEREYIFSKPKPSKLWLKSESYFHCN